MEKGMLDPAALRRHLEPQDVVDFVAEHGTPNFAPGEPGKWSYSNTGYALLGMVIEKIEGKAIDKSFETRIFGPLGMTKTYLWNEIPRKSFGLPRSWLNAPYDYETTEWNMSQGAAAGGVISTADDMHLFIEALVGGELFESSDTLALMQQSVPSDPGVEYGIGLKRIGEGHWGHDGQTLGYISIVNALDANDISVVAWATTSLNPLAYGATEITDALRQAGVIGD
jgi:D-alanyl-D-alanine carboxypeptidase